MVAEEPTDLDKTLTAVRIHGWRVVLLHQRTKRPDGKTWHVTMNLDEVRQHVVTSNIGLVCGPDSGVAVIDLDDVEAGREMMQVLGDIPVTVVTGSGKWHCYVRWEPGLAAKIEWKGRVVGEVQRGPVEVGQTQLQHVVMPPSIHPDTGRRYAWAGTASVPDRLPAAWRDHLSGAVAKVRTGAVSHGLTIEQRIAFARRWLETRPVAVQGSGGDNRTYITAASVAYDHDLPEDDAYLAMRDWNTRCVPPWSEVDLRQKIRSALKSAIGARGEKLYLHEPLPPPSFVPYGREGCEHLWEPLTPTVMEATDEEKAEMQGLDGTNDDFETIEELLRELAPEPDDDVAPTDAYVEDTLPGDEE